MRKILLLEILFAHWQNQVQEMNVLDMEATGLLAGMQKLKLLKPFYLVYVQSEKLYCTFRNRECKIGFVSLIRFISFHDE